MYCNILVTKPFDQYFTYKFNIDQKIKKGSLVMVPFGKKKDQIGLVYEIIDVLPTEIEKLHIREIISVFENIVLNEKLIQFVDWIADYTLAPKGLVLKLILINNKIVNYDLSDNFQNIIKTEEIKLNAEQLESYNVINKALISKFHPIVLQGVTGSGKTEVYFEAIKKILKQQKQALVMLPEISLTPQFQERFKIRFGFTPDIWHSKVTEKKKKIIWHRCYQGKSIIVVGTRSSLFLPFNNLGLIVVDEEHDLSFKQEDQIRYQARDLAIVKSKIEKIPIVLSSATPSLETHHNIQLKKFTHLFLSSQFSGLKLPDIKLIDMKNEQLKNNQWISQTILNAVKKSLLKGEQSLLFLNRRGYSPLVLCYSCGFRHQCIQCSSWLVMHKKKNRLLCHHCGLISSIENTCVKCQTPDSLKPVGPGVERLAEEIESIFPNYSSKIMSSDTANTPNKIKKIVDDFENKKIDILVATQIMAKGYHFPNLSIVGVIDADLGLMGGDMRAIERTYNLLQQVSGRAGRAKKVGQVFIQTYHPDNPVISSFKNRDRDSFIKKTLEERRLFNIPPFSFMTAIILSGTSKAKVESFANKLVKSYVIEKGIDILGTVEAPLFLLRGRYRYRLLLKGDKRNRLNALTRKIIEKTPIPSAIRITIDVDPYTFM